MKIVWTPEAELDREEIFDYIAADNPRAAVRMDELFDEAVARLRHFPLLGGVGTVAGTRELIPHPSYRVVYQVEVEGEAVWVLAVVHTARQWPPARS